jgi:hypothetical protein
MQRNKVLMTIKRLFLPGVAILITVQALAAEAPTADWLARWEKNIINDGRDRYCDREMGEEIGWLISPFLNGYYYGYLATHDTQWVDRLTNWADAWIQRGVTEPDGYIGWPKADGAGTGVGRGPVTDSLLGEAMALRPVVLMAGEIQKTPALKQRYGTKADGYLKLSEQIFQKWDARGCWREVKDGGVWGEPPFGIDRQTGKWTDGYARRTTDGFTLPANKQNLVAEWLMAMYDVTGRPVYRDRAEKWWRWMRSRMKLRGDGKYFVWDYWDPAGPWDYYLFGLPRHWIGVHPNGVYYDIDVDGIVTAYRHGLVFTKDDIDRLIATNRDFMWNQQVEGARFRRIDGGTPDRRWKDTPGVIWTALVPYDGTLRKIFEANYDPANWAGLSATPWYLAVGSRER